MTQANIHLRVSPAAKAEWDKMLSDRKISQQDAGAALVAWIVTVTPHAQAVIFGQLPATPEVQQ